LSYTKSEFTSLKSARRRWMLLAFMSGTINSGGFLACGRWVTHVTGFATFFGIDLVTAQYKLALSMLIVPLFFLLGSFFSGYLIDVRQAAKKEPRYDVVMVTITGILIFCAVGGGYGLFGIFRDTINVETDISMLILLCFASGLQNALITTSSGAVIRTTHLTGLTTDLGIGLAKNLAKRLTPTLTLNQNDLVNNRIRSGIILSFILGSAVGAYTFIEFEYWGFLFPAAISLYATSLVFKHKHKHKKKRATTN
jgi:uncharacterized membrane protein YoaK (UPF0700 family)